MEWIKRRQSDTTPNKGRKLNVSRTENGIIIEQNRAGRKMSMDSRHKSVAENAKDRIGTKVMQNCGYMAECIAYRDSNHCDVSFEDGTVKTDRVWRDFLKGLVSKIDRHDLEKKERTGMKIMQADGMAECTRYGSNRDFDVRFEDGTELFQVQKWGDFRDGRLRKDHHRRKDIIRVGLRVRQSCGEMAECTAYRNYRDCDVRFEDGTVRNNVNFIVFSHGELAKKGRKDAGRDRVGMKIVQKCGLTAECIAYRKSGDCDFLLSDGTEIRHMNWLSFTNGQFYPGSKNAEERSRERQGQKIMQNCGQVGECIRYGSYRDCDIKLEDGRIYEHKLYSQFKKGQIGSISVVEKGDINRRNAAGTIVIQKCGLKAECTAYRDARDIDVLFEDGTEASVYTDWWAFRNGDINHGSLVGKRKGMKGNFAGYNTRWVYGEGKNAEYECEDIKTGEKHIMTPRQMMKSRGIEPIF